MNVKIWKVNVVSRLTICDAAASKKKIKNYKPLSLRQHSAFAVVEPRKSKSPRQNFADTLFHA